MTFTETYKTHAYADLIAEAEKQGIERGIKAEQERIIKLLEENDHYSIDWLIELIKGETE